MEQLSNTLLIEAYIEAIQLNLNPDFIEQLIVEMKKRGLKEQVVTSTNQLA